MQIPPIVECTLLCHHCGDACPDDPIHLGEDKHFCCQGCKTVYEILSANGLCTYYDLSDNAGISLKGRDYGQDQIEKLTNARNLGQPVRLRYARGKSSSSGPPMPART